MQYMELKGTDTRFFTLFDTYLKEEARNAGQEFASAVEKMEKMSENLEEEITTKKMAIEEKIEKELSAIDPTDLDNKHRIWDEYYEELDTLGTIYQKELQKIVATILQTA